MAYTKDDFSPLKRILRSTLSSVDLTVDLALTLLSLQLAIGLRQKVSLGVDLTRFRFFAPDPIIRGVMCLTWAFFLSLFGVYASKRRAGLWAELLALAKALLSSLGVLALAIFLLDYDLFSRLLYLYFAIINACVLSFAHLGLRAVRSLFDETSRPRRVLVVGTGPDAQAIASVLIERGARHGLRVVGFLRAFDDPTTELLGRPVLGAVTSARGLVRDNGIQEIVVALPAQHRGNVASLFRALQDLPIQIRLAPDALDRTLARSALEELAGVELLTLREPPLQALDRAIKRVLDLVGAAIGLVLFSPVMAVIAILIKRDSPGPVLFRQTRVGKNGKPFTFYKFRSMVHNADVHVHREYYHGLIHGNPGGPSVGTVQDANLKMAGDSRITRLGHILRKSSLDELPQLFNVLKGEMSLVGPRPPIPYEVEEYTEWHRHRLEATPGMTGLWQVRGRSQIGFEEMVRMDIEYIERRSLWLDLKILLLTPYAVISGKGAG